jgi:hypothetical protein
MPDFTDRMQSLHLEQEMEKKIRAMLPTDQETIQKAINHMIATYIDNGWAPHDTTCEIEKIVIDALTDEAKRRLGDVRIWWKYQWGPVGEEMAYYMSGRGFFPNEVRMTNEDLEEGIRKHLDDGKMFQAIKLVREERQELGISESRDYVIAHMTEEDLEKFEALKSDGQKLKEARQRIAELENELKKATTCSQCGWDGCGYMCRDCQ